MSEGAMSYQTLDSITSGNISAVGIPPAESEALLTGLRKILRDHGNSPPETWRSISRRLLNPNHPFAFHQMMYYGCYRGYDSSTPPAWIPDIASATLTNIGQVLERHGREFLGLKYKDPISSFSDFQKFSTTNPEAYWQLVFKELDVSFSVLPSCILREHTSYPGGQWLPGASLNSAGNCLSLNDKRDLNRVMIIWRDEGHDSLPLHRMTLKELREEVWLVANALELLGLAKGAAIAIDMPMTVKAVIVYLAIVLAGFVVVSIADSFAPTEISTRLKISNAKAIFTQVVKYETPNSLVLTLPPWYIDACSEDYATDFLLAVISIYHSHCIMQEYIIRGARNLPLYSKVVDACAPLAIVLPSTGSSLTMELRDGDISWHDFLQRVEGSKAGEYIAVEQPIETFTNILFSSGTTGEPKAIPWTHATPLKAAADGWSHMDIHKGDVIAWPTNLGWMMGPWLVYATLLNGATMALYNGSPLGTGFAKFVQDARVTMLGVVPSIVRAWKNSNCTAGLDWSNIRCFSSTGEASSADEYLWLMGRAHYKPVIEYCGGTEIGGGFVSGSLLQDQALAAFSTPSMGCTLFILDNDGKPLPQDAIGIGELALDPLMFGASITLLNANHYDVYFKEMPTWNGKVLRRHGDEFERTAGGYYRAHGRADDTMNLGGIKVSSVEIERICNAADDTILETAAIGVPQSGGGPEQLVIAVVFKDQSSLTANLDQIKLAFNSSLQKKLNPLFKVSSVVALSSLPRTASNKVMRRVLRYQLSQRTKL